MLFAVFAALFFIRHFGVFRLFGRIDGFQQADAFLFAERAALRIASLGSAHAVARVGGAVAVIHGFSEDVL